MWLVFSVWYNSVNILKNVGTVYVPDCHSISDTISLLLWKYRIQISSPRSGNLFGPPTQVLR